MQVGSRGVIKKKSIPANYYKPTAILMKPRKSVPIPHHSTKDNSRLLKERLSSRQADHGSVGIGESDSEMAESPGPLENCDHSFRIHERRMKK